MLVEIIIEEYDGEKNIKDIQNLFKNYSVIYSYMFSLYKKK